MKLPIHEHFKIYGTLIASSATFFAFAVTYAYRSFLYDDLGIGIQPWLSRTDVVAYIIAFAIIGAIVYVALITPRPYLLVPFLIGVGLAGIGQNQAWPMALFIFLIVLAIVAAKAIQYIVRRGQLANLSWVIIAAMMALCLGLSYVNARVRIAQMSNYNVVELKSKKYVIFEMQGSRYLLLRLCSGGQVKYGSFRLVNVESVEETRSVSMRLQPAYCKG